MEVAPTDADHFPGYTKEGVALLLTAGFLISTSVILYVLRAASASKKLGKWRIDFIFISVAVSLMVASFALMERALRYGLGHHTIDLSYHQITKVIEFTVLYLSLFILSTTFAKFSTIALLVPVQGIQSPARVYGLYAIGVLQAVFAIPLVFLIIFECDPVPRLWNVMGPGSCPRKELTHQWALAQGAISAFVDFALAAWPLLMVPSLKVSFKTKVGFCLLMSVGSIAGVASILRDVVTQESVSGNDTVFTYQKLVLWSVVEQTTIIILSTIPTLRPLFRKWFGRETPAVSSKSRPYGGYDLSSHGQNTLLKPHTPPVEESAEPKEGKINVSTTYTVQPLDDVELGQYPRGSPDMERFRG
ncbi:hypothetical protein K461DRAFT_319926 [Myriangium duriaei CBS 260.36]|uniref:Rhodopsin domain-containing protein n=1 Tax=Myriangium duriaei CBS 260.36 TaxID=1168546 RepID=A0A9P4J402_9PEZI|nr:hypothetical protein K461DRAFT_319926 [Myriangium duriaei CBS 260.36]